MCALFFRTRFRLWWCKNIGIDHAVTESQLDTVWHFYGAQCSYHRITENHRQDTLDATVQILVRSCATHKSLHYDCTRSRINNEIEFSGAVYFLTYLLTITESLQGCRLVYAT